MVAPLQRQMSVAGLGDLQLDPDEADVKRHIRDGHSYVASINLAASGFGSNYGVLQPYGGFGLYLMHQSPSNTVIEVRFDQDFARPVVFRRGGLHLPGPVSQKRAPQYFSQFWAKAVQGGDTAGTAYFLVLGSPMALFTEDPRTIAYKPAVTTTNTSSTITTVLAATEILTTRNLRLTVINAGGTALVSAPVQVTADGTTWEEIMVGTFNNIAASTAISAAVPDGVRQIRMRAATSSSSTAISTYLTGTMG